MPLPENISDNTFGFIQGGGEMGVLTRAFPWAGSPLGTPDQWPQALRTTLGIVLHSAFPMFLFWGDDLVCFYNDAFRPSLGENGKHPAVGKCGSAVWADIWDFIGPLIRQVMETGEPVWFEDQYVPFFRNGKTEDIYWTFSYSPAYGDHGGINGVFVTCTETTAKVQLVRKLSASDKQVRQMVESAPFPIALYAGQEMRIIMANQAIMKAWGKGKEVIGKLFNEALWELHRDNPEIWERLEGVYHTGVPFHTRNERVQLQVGDQLQLRYFNYSFTPLYDVDGQVYGVMNTAAEVTDLNIAKQQIERSERNFRAMVLQAPAAMCILSGPAFIIEVANDLMITLWGKPREAVMNRPVFEALPDAREQGLEKLMADVYRTGIAFKADERPVKLLRNGQWETVYQNFVYEAHRDADGAILGVLVISIDVTAQVLARQEIEAVVAVRTRALAEVNGILQRSNAELAQFAHIASHDLQEPVRKVSNFAQLLERHLHDHLDERGAGYISRIRNSASRMLALIKDVLAYSELSSAEPEFTRVSLQQVVEEVRADFELLIEQKNAQISVQELPVIAAISLQLTQLFGNLLSNALKYSRASVPPVITITAAETDGKTWLPDAAAGVTYYRIEVKDNGIGFSQEHADQIFHIFQRLHGKTDYEGTGIGLAICQKIVQNHHGVIFAQSEVGVGSCFVMVLPAAQSPQ